MSHAKKEETLKTLTLSDQLNIELFTAKDVRDLLKARAHCLAAGFSPDDAIIQTLTEIKNQYLLRVGLPAYISQMLGELATTPTRECRLYTLQGERIATHGIQQQVQKFINNRFMWDEIPARVETEKGVKYL